MSRTKNISNVSLLPVSHCYLCLTVTCVLLLPVSHCYPLSLRLSNLTRNPVFNIKRFVLFNIRGFCILTCEPLCLGAISCELFLCVYFFGYRTQHTRIHTLPRTNYIYSKSANLCKTTEHVYPLN